MIVHKLSLQNFRNFEQLDMVLSEGVNILYGDNAQGKTNLLESIYFCATGHSRRTNVDKDLIRFNHEQAHIRLFTRRWQDRQNKRDMHVHPDDYENKIDIHLKKDRSKGIAVNGLPIRKLGQLFGVLLVVIFSPEDLQLVKAGPSERRKFMDMELCQISPVYCYDLQQYYRILKQRNNLLKSIRHQKMSKETLFVWDEQLAAHGVKILKQRQAFIEQINIFANRIHEAITNNAESLQISYRPNITESDFLEKLQKNVDRDIALGVTSVGAHKDDLAFLINHMDVRVFGSQGQQRTASLSAKLAEIDVIQAQRKRRPVLLLDDVLSELDETRQTFLLKSIAESQSIMTCTGLNSLIGKIAADYRTYKVKEGTITLT